MGVLDQDVDDKVSLAVPQLYRRGIERQEWTQPKFWMYMMDGTNQSDVALFMVNLLFSPATFNTSNGLGIDDFNRMGVYLASIAVVVANVYVLFNTFRWDWLMVLITVISTLFIWFWTGVWTSGLVAGQFYGAAREVYGSLSFWAILLVASVICLLPRVTVKSIQKIYFPRDVDVIREQVAQGQFDYLKEIDSFIPPPPEKADTVSSQGSKTKAANVHAGEEDTRPIYPPSIAPTATTHNPRSQNGSNSTDYTFRRSLEAIPSNRFSMDRPRPSYDRARMSMDRVRPSFEASSDFTSAAFLARVESRNSQSSVPQTGRTMSRLRKFSLRRPTITREEQPEIRHPPMPQS
jgi:phospholipid-translocating ATPase